MCFSVIFKTAYAPSVCRLKQSSITLQCSHGIVQFLKKNDKINKITNSLKRFIISMLDYVFGKVAIVLIYKHIMYCF